MQVERSTSNSVQEAQKAASPRPKSSPSLDEYKQIIVRDVLNKSKFTVYLVEAPKAQKKLAMKVFPFRDDEVNKCYIKEARFHDLCHSNIIRVVDSEPERSSTAHGKTFNVSYILMELAPYGDFADFVMAKQYPKDERLVRSYFHQLVDGVEYLHSKDIAHLDLKPENLLIGNDYELKITDFDSSVFLNEERVGSKAGTKNYRAPELINQQCSDPKAADIFSMGVILFILKAGIFPYAQGMVIDGHNLFEMIIKGDQNFWNVHPKCKEYPELFSQEFRSLFFAMTAEDPAKRPTIQEIQDYEWYKGAVYSEKSLSSIAKYTLKIIQNSKKNKN